METEWQLYTGSLYSDTNWHLAHLSHAPIVICSCTVTLIDTWHICHTHQLWQAAAMWHLLALGTFVTHASCDMQLHRIHMPLQMHSLTHLCSQQAHCNGCWTYRVCQLLEFVTPVTQEWQPDWMCCLCYTVLQLEILLWHKSGDHVRWRTPHSNCQLFILLTVYILSDSQECVLLYISDVQGSWCELEQHVYSLTIYFVFYITPKMKAQSTR